MAAKQSSAGGEVVVVSTPLEGEVEVISVCVREGDRVRKGSVLCQYQPRNGSGAMQSLKSPTVGIVRRVVMSNGDIAAPKSEVVSIEEHCDHSVVAFDLCAICGANLKSEQGISEAASVSMLHAIPQVRISQKEAALLGNKDKQRLLSSRKLALVVDLDQTLIHTSVDPHIEPGLPDVHQFSLPGHRYIYHCRLRPSAKEFLSAVSQLYEMHVFTMGTKDYAIAVTQILDPERKLFSDRVISRDECFDPHSKALRLRSVFPCGDEMVAIIDDREDIWGRCANLVHVKPYVFFAGTADINAPPSSHRRDLRQPHSKPLEIRPQQQRLVQTVTHEHKVTADNSNNSNNTRDKEDERSRGKEDESSSSSSSDSSSSDSDSSSSSSEDESGGDTAKVTVLSTAGIEDCQNVHTSSLSTAQEKHSIGQEETVPDTRTVPDAHTIQPVSDTTKPEPSTGSRTKINDPDKFLLSLEKILQRVHTIFYTEYDSVQQTNTTDNMDRRGSCGDDIPTPDLKQIIPKFRKSVLEGAKLVFTGVIPTNMPMERSREWNTARAFGAVVQLQLIPGKGKAEITSEATTHLIVGRPGTNKHRQALKMKGLKVVNSKWLWACAEQWEWVDETLFAPDLPPEGPTKPIKEKKELEVKEQTKTEAEEESSSKSDSDPGPVSISVLQMGAGSSRHRSHRFSVSSEELEKMEAEINRELSIEEEDDDESEEEEEDRLGSYVKNDNQTESMDTFEQYLGLETDSSELSRKRKHDEVEISSSNSNSPEDHSQSVRVSEDEEEDDELADLLGL